MATSAATWTREALATAPQTYFDAVDAMDVDGVLAHFADDATLTVQTDHVTFNGADEIRRMFTDFFGASGAIRHEIRNIVVEEARARSRRSRATSASSRTARRTTCTTATSSTSTRTGSSSA